MTIDQRGRRFRVRRMIKGQVYVATFPTYDEAKVHDLELERAVLRGEAPPARTALAPVSSDIATMRDLYDHTCKTEWANKSRILRDNALRFVEWVGDQKSPRQALTPANIDAFTIHRESTLGQSPKTVNRYLSAVSVLLRVAKRFKLVDPVDLPWRKEAKGRIRYYTEHEEEQIYRALRDAGYHEVVELFVCLCDTGGRLEEVRRLKWSEVSEHYVEFVKTKTDLPRSVPLTARAKAVFDAKQARAGHLPGPFFDVQMYVIRDAWKAVKARLKWMDNECVIHTFRHTCCTRLVTAGHGDLHVQRWMGHKTLATTRRYAHFNTNSLNHMLSALESKRVVANGTAPAQAVA